MRSWILFYALFATFTSLFASSPVPDLERPYAGLKTLSCDVERITKTQQGKLRVLSRVFHQAPGRLLVENFSPGRRKILYDGTTLHFYDTSFQKGFRQETSKLDAWWISQLTNLPCTPFEHTRRLRGAESRLLRDEGGDRLFGYAVSNAWVEVRVGKDDLIQAIDLYSDADHGTQYGHVAYTAHAVVAGVPVITAMTSWKQVGEERVEATVTFWNIRVNEPMADRLFDAKIHFEGVEFVDEYKKTLE